MMANLSEDIQYTGKTILKSIDEGPFKMGKFRETLAEGTEGALYLGPERDRVFVDLTPEEKERFKAGICAMNIVLQGLPKDIYTLINYYTDAKDIWDNMKMLLKGSELTKDECESQLYDEFEHFRQTQRRKPINELLCQQCSPLQYPYINLQLIPLSAYSHQLIHHHNLADNTRQIQNLPQLMIVEKTYYKKTVALLAQSYKTHLPQTNNQLRTSSNTRNQATVQNGRVVVQNIQGRQNRGQGNYARRAVAVECKTMHSPKATTELEYLKTRCADASSGECSGFVLIEQVVCIAGRLLQCDDDVDEAPIQDLALNEDNVWISQKSQEKQSYKRQAPERESEECKQKPKIQSQNQKIQASVKSSQGNVLIIGQPKFNKLPKELRSDQYGLCLAREL
ncbi:hypothetical protein Tco_0964990 [Tanacetum coccineum]